MMTECVEYEGEMPFEGCKGCIHFVGGECLLEKGEILSLIYIPPEFEEENRDVGTT